MGRRLPGDRRSALLTCLLLASVLAACGTPNPPRLAPATDQFRWAVRNYTEGSWQAAIQGLENFLSTNPVHPKADSAQYLLADSYLKSNQPQRAAEEFRQMAITRPGSPLADDAQLGACRAFWEQSPGLPRGQEHTRTAVQECERVSEFFPESSLIPEAEEILRRARDKLARKQFRVARYYFDRGFYESANIYFETVLQRYPEASVVPEVLLRYHRSLRSLGFDAEASQVRERLLSDHPESEAAAELRGAGG